MLLCAALLLDGQLERGIFRHLQSRAEYQSPIFPSRASGHRGPGSSVERQEENGDNFLANYRCEAFVGPIKVCGKSYKVGGNMLD